MRRLIFPASPASSILRDFERDANHRAMIPVIHPFIETHRDRYIRKRCRSHDGEPSTTQTRRTAENNNRTDFTFQRFTSHGSSSFHLPVVSRFGEKAGERRALIAPANKSAVLRSPLSLSLSQMRDVNEIQIRVKAGRNRSKCSRRSQAGSGLPFFFFFNQRTNASASSLGGFRDGVILSGDFPVTRPEKCVSHCRARKRAPRTQFHVRRSHGERATGAAKPRKDARITRGDYARRNSGCHGSVCGLK